MTLQEAIDLIKKVSNVRGWEVHEIAWGVSDDRGAEAIATILNAVVKGELK